MTAGTIFQDTRLPLRTWFRTMWFEKRGERTSILGLGSYRTAWALLSCGARWCGPAENGSAVALTYVGGAEEGLIAAEEDGSV